MIIVIVKKPTLFGTRLKVLRFDADIIHISSEGVLCIQEYVYDRRQTIVAFANGEWHTVCKGEHAEIMDGDK